MNTIKMEENVKMDDRDFTVFDDKENEIVDPELVDAAGTEDDEDDYEKVCFVCRRPESKCGKMINMQPGLSICPEACG